MLSTWTQDDLLIGDVRLHYYRTGHGDKPPLVLIHGFSDNGLCWSRTAHDLEADYDVVMPDVRGHGLSQRMRPGDRIDLAGDVAGLLKALQLGPAILVGHSMGAMIAFEIGWRYPALVKAMALEDPPWWMPEPAAREDPSTGPQPPEGESHADPMAAWARTLQDKTLEELLAQYAEENPGWPPEVVGPMAESKKQLDQRTVDALIDKLKASRPDWQDNIARVTQPMLIMTGSPDRGSIVTPEVEARVWQLNPAVTIVNVPGVGHLIRYDNYDAFMAALRRFLRQLPS